MWPGASGSWWQGGLRITHLRLGNGLDIAGAGPAALSGQAGGVPAPLNRYSGPINMSSKAGLCISDSMTWPRSVSLTENFDILLSSSATHREGGTEL